MASLLTEIPDVLDMRELWLTNMLLLGFDPIACEEKYKLPFTRDMFVHINKKGMEVSMHFLFSKLDSHVTYEEFRDCWPVYDKKQEQQFRKTCANWLAKIAKDDPTSKLPRIAAPLLLSPGGDKFYQLMLRLSAYVLRVVCLRDAKANGERQVFISSFLTSPEGIQPAMKDVSLEAIKAHIVRHTGRVTDRLQLAAGLHDEWRKYASHLTSEYRVTSKGNRELTQKLEALKEQRANFSNVIENSVAPSLTSPEAEAVKRKARIAKVKKVREMWKNIEEFELKTSRQREEVEAILEQKGTKQVISAQDIAFQISDLIFQMYEKDIREGNIANTYQAGKLSLSGLIQVWNCALSILKDHLSNNELPAFEAEADCVNDKLQAHRGHHATVQTLRVQLNKLQQNVLSSTEEIKTRLEELKKRQVSAPPLPSVSVPILGVDLLPPSPTTKSFASPDRTLLAPLSPPPINDSTPDAIHNISRSVHVASRQALKPKTFSSSIPVRATPSASGAGGSSAAMTIDTSLVYTPTASSLIYTPGVVRAASTQNDEMTGPVRPATSTKRSRKGVVDKGIKGIKGTKVVPKGTGTSSSRGKVLEWVPKGEPDEVQLYSPLPNTSSASCSKESDRTLLPCPINATDMDNAVASEANRLDHSKLLKPHDLLADQIATEVAMGTAHDQSPSTPKATEQLHSFIDPLSALGTEAFVSKDKVPRTPCTKSKMQQPCSDLDHTPLLAADSGKAPEVTRVLDKLSLMPSANGTPKDDSSALSCSGSVPAQPTTVGSVGSGLLGHSPSIPPEPKIASSVLTALPSSSWSSSSAKTPRGSSSRMIAFESPLPLLPLSPSPPVAVTGAGLVVQSTAAATSTVLASPAPLISLGISSPQPHISSTPFRPSPRPLAMGSPPGTTPGLAGSPMALMEVNSPPGGHGSTSHSPLPPGGHGSTPHSPSPPGGHGSTPHSPSPPGGHGSTPHSPSPPGGHGSTPHSPLPSGGHGSTPHFPFHRPGAEPASGGNLGDSKAEGRVSRERCSVRKGRAERSKLDLSSLLDSNSPQVAGLHCSVPTSVQGNLLEFSPQNLLSYCPDHNAALETSDLTGRGMFDSDDGSSLLASMSTNSSQCSPTEMPE